MRTRPMGPTSIRSYAGYHVVAFTFASCPLEAVVPDQGTPVIRDVSGKAWFLRRLPIDSYLRDWIAETYVDAEANVDPSAVASRALLTV